MASEITKRDRSHNTAPQIKRTYGRGSKIKRKWAGEDDVYILITYHAGFWSAQNSKGFLVNVGDGDIDKILVDGHWVNFDGNPRNWKKNY